MAERVVPLIFNGMAIGADWMSADAGIIVGLAMTFGYIFAAKYGDCTIRGFNLRYPKQTIYKDGEVYMDD